MASSTQIEACRSCGGTSLSSVANLGKMPPANALVPEGSEDVPEEFALHALLCETCHLVQLSELVAESDIFSDYAYFSSYSSSWLEHAERYVEQIVERLSLGPSDRVVELASNDGYLLRNFVRAGIPSLGVEPAENVARAAAAIGVPTDVSFFGDETARRIAADFGSADLIIANNVLAHVPDLNDFIGGAARLLAPDGVWTIEVPHLLRLIDDVQFDTIYHEHYSYFSLLAARTALERHGLRAFSIEELPTHGGSLRIYVSHSASARQVEPSVERVLQLERSRGLDDPAEFSRFQSRVERRAEAFKRFLAEPRNQPIVGYGAAAKGITLLNYCEVSSDQIPYVVDLNPHKQGHLLPGSRIAVAAPTRVLDERSLEYLLVLPWNLWDEIRAQMAGIRVWGGRFAYLAADQVVAS